MKSKLLHCELKPCSCFSVYDSSGPLKSSSGRSFVCVMTPAPSVPSQIAGYSVLSLSLPPLPSFPKEATHYLYISPHQPKIPQPNAERSLFLVNVPFDATIIHLKHLLSLQIGLPAGRIEDVRFEGQKGVGGYGEDAPLGKQILDAKGKKRKRGGKSIEAGHIKGAELPSTCDRDLIMGNLTAVAVFIDKSSAAAALRAVKRVQKEKMRPVWGEGVEDRVPALGSSSVSDQIAGEQSIVLIFHKDILSITVSPTLIKALCSNLSTII